MDSQVLDQRTKEAKTLPLGKLVIMSFPSFWLLPNADRYTVSSNTVLTEPIQVESGVPDLDDSCAWLLVMT